MWSIGLGSSELSNAQILSAALQRLRQQQVALLGFGLFQRG
jgi:hypothetical protein